MTRVGTVGMFLCCSVSCGSGQQEAVAGGAPEPTPAATLQQALQEQEDTQQLLRRIDFQEWLDHTQRAWVPVAALSELALAWPEAVRATQVTVSHREFTVQTTSSSAAQALAASLTGLQWVDAVAVSDRLVSGHVASVKRALAPESDRELLEEAARLTQAHAYGSTHTVADKNDPQMLAGAADAFNCWRRVLQKTERYQRLDGSWSEAGMGEVRPDTPVVSIGHWEAQPEEEVGRAYTRHRASLALRGPFPALVKGLDCTRSTSVVYSVRTLSFAPDPAAPGHAALRLVVDLPRPAAPDPERQTPWAQPGSWGEAEPPERSRTLADRTLVDPFGE